MDLYLLEQLHEQKLQGQKPDRNFNPSAYGVAVDAINARFPVKVNKDKMQNRLKTLKWKMDIALEVFKRDNGFAWNDITKKIDATNYVWDALIKSYPDAKKVRNATLPYLNLLREIFEKDRATGGATESAKEKNRHWTNEENERRLANEGKTIEDIDDLLARNEIDLENFEDEYTIQQSSTAYVPSASASASSSSSKGNKKKTTKTDELNNNINNITGTENKIASALDKANVVAEKANAVAEKGTRRFYLGEEVFLELQAMEGIDKTFLFAGYDFLISDSVAAEGFFGCPVHMHKDWLSWKMTMKS
ncbi:uncharacterized protein At2g29880-like [Cornus florida]|uniref:uncharacterized protein At2g29880-like n=1 Tax=Cornus florida TaxID=4283 RepID=UPI00289A64EA|nr:uncharacterized protein At2g29880-like [Cornus florida]